MEFLKEILGEELYSQVNEKVNSYNSDEKNKESQIKIGNLGSGNYVGKDKFDAKETEISGLKQQLADANATIKSYEDMDIEAIKQSAKDWETKYNTDTQALQDKLAKKDYESVVNSKIASLKFSSEGAKKSFVNDLLAKDLKLEGGNILGFDDFVTKYKETDPKAFESDTPKPQFTGDIRQPGNGNQITKEVFNKMGYQDRLKLYNENKNLYDQLVKE